jgi:hypothetical protein
MNVVNEFIITDFPYLEVTHVTPGVKKSAEIINFSTLSLTNLINLILMFSGNTGKGGNTPIQFRFFF